MRAIIAIITIITIIIHPFEAAAGVWEKDDIA